MLEVPLNIKTLLPNHQWSVGLRWVGKPMLLPRVGGVYVLLMHLQHPISIDLPQLEATSLKSGYYFYVGSANGVAGLAIKVSRHWLNKQDTEQSSVVDYLRQKMTVLGVWVIAEATETNSDALACEVSAAFSESACEVIQDLDCSNNPCSCHIFYIDDEQGQ